MTLLSLPAALRQTILKEAALEELPLRVRRQNSGIQARPYVFRAGLVLANKQLYGEYLEVAKKLVSDSRDVSFEALVVNMSCVDISGLLNFTSWRMRMTGNDAKLRIPLHVHLLMTHTERVDGHSLDRWLYYCRKVGLQATYTFECVVDDPQQTGHDYTVADIRSQNDHELVKIYTAILEWSVKQCDLMAGQAQQTFDERSALFQAMVRMGSQQVAASMIHGQVPSLPHLRKETGKARRKIKVYETAAKEAIASLDEAKRLSSLLDAAGMCEDVDSGTEDSISTLCL
ncbi:hypothetical protein LTR78_007259 [Recurvomyces mirabilis]|uniref:Uncharacterized protein n=1 Tax=Recurvomyces mirabilis TaxID=574656 RepID=A0AAE0WJL0_9PEZI|nr:hypothetical protein LTR78_007259 [Recurvomyces mirabilis]KAK5155498.1 hypothetical protein LTS14_005759 [Recurvomyces mirabilis]